MNDSLVAPIFGLIGVLIGSAISTGANFILAIRKEKAEANLKQRERAVLLRTTLRLLEADLLQAISVTAIVVEKHVRPHAIISNTKLPAWDTYKEIFAEALPSSTWHKVMTVAYATSKFNTLILYAETKSNNVIGPQELELATNLHTLLNAARKEISDVQAQHDKASRSV